MSKNLITITLAIALFAGVAIPSALASGSGGLDETVVFPASERGLDHRTQTLSNIGSLPLTFTENQGQWDEQVLFRANAGRAVMWFTESGVCYQFTRRVPGDDVGQGDPIHRNLNEFDRESDGIETMMIKATFVKANPNPRVYGLDMLEYKCNYFIGSDPDKWRTGVPTYDAAVYQELYPGIDLKYYGNGSQMEYDFIVSPGADPSYIQITYEGAKSLSVNEFGELKVETDWGTVTELRPLVYQFDGDSRIKLQAEYVILAENTFGFALPKEYNPELALVIDPILSYSTFLGGTTEAETGEDIAVDASGCAYVTGETSSTDFPILNAFTGTYVGGQGDVFVTKLDPSLSGTASLIYSTYLGGTDWDFGWSIDVGPEGNAYVTGQTNSIDFPTLNGYSSSYNGGDHDLFVTVLSVDGTILEYSSYLGGSEDDYGYGIAVDGSGNAYVTGETNSSTDFPMLNAYTSTYNGGPTDVFVTKINPLLVGGASLLYSTYLGGNWAEYGKFIDVDASGNAYVTGATWSSSFPVLGAYQNTYTGTWSDGFVTKLNPSLSGSSSLVYSTYLGGSDEDYPEGIAVDNNGCAYVTGYTTSTDYPTLNYYDNTFSGPDHDLFVSKLDPSLTGSSSLIYSTYLGGSADDIGTAIAVNAAGNAHVTGWTTSPNFPTAYPYDGTFGGHDIFVTKFAVAGNSLLFSTFLGDDNAGGFGIAVDDNDCIYLTGSAGPGIFPTVNAYQSSLPGNGSAFVAKMCPPALGACCLIAGGCVQTAGQSGCAALMPPGLYLGDGVPCSPDPCLCSIEGTVFDDAAQDGQFDGGESGLANWTITIRSSSGTLTTTSSSDGSYAFYDIPCGPWTITEQMQPFWVQTYPSPASHTPVLSPASVLSGVDFGNWRCYPTSDCVRPPYGMIAWWPLDNYPGPYTDLAGNNKAWNYLGQSPSSEPGKVNAALGFMDSPNNNEMLSASGQGLNVGTGDFSIDAWVKPATGFIATTSYGPIGYENITIVEKQYTKPGHETVGRGYSFFASTWELPQSMYGIPSEGAGLTLTIGDGTIGCFAASQNFLIPTDSWSHVAVTVDRDDPQGVVFYLDGQVIGPTESPWWVGSIVNYAGSCDNSEVLLIGGSRWNGSPDEGVAGRSRIDEVEIFKRVLDPAEVEAIYTADSYGKCKEQYIHVPSIRSFYLSTQQSVKSYFAITNLTSQQQTYRWSVAGLPVGPGCDVDGPTRFEPSSGTITVSPGGGSAQPFDVYKPTGLGSGVHACYQVTVVNDATGKCFNESGRVRGIDVFSIDPGNGAAIQYPSAGNVVFQVINNGGQTELVEYEIDAVSSNGDSASEAISLDSLPPGAVIAGSVSIPAGDSADISVQVSFDSHQPFEFQEVRLLSDIGTNQRRSPGETKSPLASVGVWSVMITDCNENGIADSLDISLGTSPDTNSNAVPDECEIPVETLPYLFSGFGPTICSFNATDSSITVDCVGEDSTVGVSLAMNNVEVVDLLFSGIDLSADSTAVAFAAVGSTVEDQIGIGSVVFSNAEGAIQIVADFDSLGDQNVLTKIYNGNTYVGESSTSEGGVIATGTDAGSGLPSVIGVGITASDPPTYIVKLDRVIEFALTDGPILPGNEIRLLATGVTDSPEGILGVIIIGTGLCHFTIDEVGISSGNCCTGLTGNIDSDPVDQIDLGDLTKLIDYLFISFTPPECIEEANVDGDQSGMVDLGDLTALIDYLFISFTPPAPCQ